MPRVLCVIPSLGGGGAERAFVTLLRHLDPARFAIRLVTLVEAGFFGNDLPGRIEVTTLEGRAQYDWRLVFRLGLLLRQERPSVVLSVLRYANMITLLAAHLCHFTAPVIVNEQNHPSAEFQQFGGRWLKGLALRRLYPRAEKVSAISRGIATDLISRWGVPADKVTLIPNPVDVARIRRLAQEAPPHPWLTEKVPVVIGVGRLHPQKDFGLLLRAFRLVRNAQPCRLIILGEGPERAFLEHEVQRLGLATDVLLPGFQENPFAWMSRAHVFVLSSRYEGFGNVIVEAMALRCPVIATNCPCGPDELIEDGVSGLLVPVGDERALAEAIRCVLSEPDLSVRLAEAGHARSEDFAPDHIVVQYEHLLAEASERHAHPRHHRHLSA